MIREILIQKIKDFSFSIGEGALELGINLFAMILIERSYNQQGLGIYSYLFSLFFIVSYLAEFGVSRYAEHEIPVNHHDPEKQSEIIANAFQAIFLTGMLCAVAFIFSAGYDTTLTRIEERGAAYLMIGLAILFRNLNHLKFSMLHGYGNHEMVAKLKMKKRFLFLGMIFFFLTIHVPPSYLTLSFLGTEIAVSIILSKKIRFPQIKTILQNLGQIPLTLKQGYRFLLTDETLDIVLYVDFLILGLFIPSWELGVYAEASVLARFFLLIPVSIKPIFRRQYLMYDKESASIFMQRTTALLFYLHSLFAIYLLLFFPQILSIFFHTQGEELISFKIFTVIIPGLLFFSAITAQEPVYEADEQVEELKNLVLIVSVINLLLNCYLVPFAGFFGSATATMISMLLYFLLFGRNLNIAFRIKKIPYLSASAGVYLIYTVLQYLNWGLLIELFLVPIFLMIIFFVMGFFNVVGEGYRM